MNPVTRCSVGQRKYENTQKELMVHTRDSIKATLRNGCSRLLESQPMLFQRAHDVNEETISMELAAEIRSEFDGYHTNCEYNRMTDEYGTQVPKRINLDPNNPNQSLVYPDIIVHRQGSGEHNLLIIEIKMAWKNHRKDHDIEKLGRYVEELRYRHALYLELGENGVEDIVWVQ